MLNETAFILSTLQKDFLVIFEAGKINKLNWAKYLEGMDYKSLYIVFEIASLYKNHIYKTKARAGLTIYNNEIELKE